MDISEFRVPPDTKIDLDDWNPDDTDGFDGDKKDAAVALEELNQRLADLQDLLASEGRRKVLVVLQGMDTAGKDGTIKHVFRSVNPLGVTVANFKRPTDEELSHDFLWRVHAKAPGNGHLTIFNRSHYEDVLVARVHDLVPKKVWKKRFDHIRAFEQLLADEGTVIVKFYLNISKEEQRKRLQSRIDDPDKNWKFEDADMAERQYWDQYREAYEDVLSRTSTEDSPWFIIPSNYKWFRNVAISSVLIAALESLGMSKPEPNPNLKGLVIE